MKQVMFKLGNSTTFTRIVYKGVENAQNKAVFLGRQVRERFPESVTLERKVLRFFFFKDPIFLYITVCMCTCTHVCTSE